MWRGYNEIYINIYRTNDLVGDVYDFKMVKDNFN